MEDWDLLAVVRGHNFNNTNMESPIFNNYNNMELLLPSPPMMSSSNSSTFALPYHQEQDDLLFNTYPHLFETNTAFDELEELYKPFYPGPGAAAPADTVTRVASSSSLSSTSSSAISSFNSLPTQADIQQDASPISNKPTRTVKEPATKYKKRKNQQKRVVKEVREDGLSSDMWAWRKYGQKPIKGSPYPRSYYRCSSSKGCSARKQVERNPTNPEIFIITYTAEHTHAHPTRRNSLAGSTRSKFPNVLGSKPEKIITNNSEYCSSKDDIDDDGDDHKDMALDIGDSGSSEIDMKLEVVLGQNNGHDHHHHHHQMMLASLDDLERGLEELDHEETSNNNNNDDDKSELLLDSRFFDDDQFIDANWFVDQYNTTVTGSC